MSKRANKRNRRRKKYQVGQLPRRPTSRTNGHTPKADVDIVIPVHGGPDFLLACLASLYDHELGVEANVILVDDCGPDARKMTPVFHYAETKGARIIKHKENLGFAAACNSGAAAGRSPLILLLNSDTMILHDGWLGAMAAQAANPKTGVVGCLLTFFEDNLDWAPLDLSERIRPRGKVQHAGVVFDVLARPYHVFWGWDADHPKVAQVREMNCVTGACLLAKRRLWDHLGGLDTDYTKGNFEDVQFCLQARHEGYAVVFTPEAHLAHYAGGSGNSMTADRNAQLFKVKAAHLVQYDEWAWW